MVVFRRSQSSFSSIINRLILVCLTKRPSFVLVDFFDIEELYLLGYFSVRYGYMINRHWQIAYKFQR